MANVSIHEYISKIYSRYNNIFSPKYLHITNWAKIINIYRTRSGISLLSSTVQLSNIVPQKLVKNINLEGKNKALSDIVRTLQKLKEIQAAVCNRADTVPRNKVGQLQ